MHGAAGSHEVLSWTNLALHAGNRDLFCTAIFSTLERVDDTSWRFTSVAGGHPLPIVVSADGSTHTVGRPGTLLGVFREISTTTGEAILHPGDTLILHTDGVTDVRPPYELDPETVIALASEAADGARTADDIATRLGLAIHRVLPHSGASRRRGTRGRAYPAVIRVVLPELSNTASESDVSLGSNG